MNAMPFAATTPVSVGRIGLMARDANRVADFYKAVLGLGELRNSGRGIGLGAAGRESFPSSSRIRCAPTTRARPASTTRRSCCPAAPIWRAGCAMRSICASPLTARPTISSARRSI